MKANFLLGSDSSKCRRPCTSSETRQPTKISSHFEKFNPQPTYGNVSANENGLWKLLNRKIAGNGRFHSPKSHPRMHIPANLSRALSLSLSLISHEHGRAT